MVCNMPCFSATALLAILPRFQRCVCMCVKPTHTTIKACHSFSQHQNPQILSITGSLGQWIHQSFYEVCGGGVHQQKTMLSHILCLSMLLNSQPFFFFGVATQEAEKQWDLQVFSQKTNYYRVINAAKPELQILLLKLFLLMMNEMVVKQADELNSRPVNKSTEMSRRQVDLSFPISTS